MANIMNLKNLENKVHKQGFDESERNCFTAKVGELLPICTKHLYPNKKYKINLSHFSRTTPLNTAAYTRVREYVDVFFVPYRLLWRYSDQFFIQMNDSYVATSPTANGTSSVDKFPTFNSSTFAAKLFSLFNASEPSSADNYPELQPYIKDMFGVSRWATISKLAEYLDYGHYSVYDWQHSAPTQVFNVVMNLFRFAAYQKIYYDYFRLSQWEKNEPKNYNLDYITPSTGSFYGAELVDTIHESTNTMFDLRYVNYNKDMFTGVLPNSQFGDESKVTISSIGGSLEYRFVKGSSIPNTDVNPDNLEMYNGMLRDSSITGDSANIKSIQLYADNLGSMSILALRQAEALQKWKEIAYSGNEDYRTQIKKHFGIDPGPVRSMLCEHIGGYESNIVINEVVNTNITEDLPADIAGKGISGSKGFIEYEAKEHGLLMAVYYAKPLLDYAAIGIAPDNLKNTPTDYVIPEFDKIGMQPVPSIWLNGVRGNIDASSSEIGDLSTSYLGFAPRYIEFKTSVDKVRGGFLNTFNTWVTAWTPDYISNMLLENLRNTGRVFNYQSFKVSPRALDPILSVQSDSYDDTRSDHILVSADFDISSVQPIDRDGLPY